MNLLHRATHRLPGVPAHVDHPAGHHREPQPQPHHRRRHAPDRRAWFLPAWQRRIAALFGRES
ncbi:hypothetical protein BJY16_006544 [Actinoplanes octamycinicus]|uniref:Uncharacterized protein n=1 Tax=Actinoplanes octamycinicus TaxID=135948 RepID=A0A7W7MAQ9_9ACTN|nr:hypothetical protein [Actinoplanes octamycinicus]MBB4743085.1 hypothetical protein [Actinoplanes octamycinicus]GIE61353.1 hypothetical protein Aoc01nite_67550 [Actinoplanes octamycinicus]